MKLTEAINIVKPKPLPEGGTIGITAPSSQINVQNISNFKKLVEEAGFNVILGETITNMYDRDYNSAQDDTRARDFNRMIKDDNIDVVWSGAGGFGAQMIAEHIDYEAIVNNPKPIIGFSDNTFFLNAITQKTNVTTFLGPTAEVSEKDKDSASLKYAIAVLMGSMEIPYVVENLDSTVIRKVSRHLDQVVGRFVGGNLTMLQTSLGTEFEIDTSGKILLIEEVGESSYSVERALRHLEKSGKFDNPAAVVFGEFSNIKREPIENSHDSNPSINEILAKMFNDAPYPVLMNYAFSHGDFNLTFPIGSMGKVDSQVRELEILDNPVR